MSAAAAIGARPDVSDRFAAVRGGGVAIHASIIAFIIATQILYTPARDLGPDNTWHYRFAHDIVTGVPVFWAGLDGNRLFPDLLFALAAFVLSGKSSFAGWLPYFYVLFFLALYASLIALAATFYQSAAERRAFVLLAVAGLWLFELAAPFWPRWFFDPGNHGTGLPVAFGCLALLFHMNRTGRFSVPAALVFLIAVALLIGSNRFLLLVFLIPLVAALAATLARRAAASRVSSVAAAERPGHLVPLLVMVGVAGAGGYLAYKGLGDLNWHKSTTYMDVEAVSRRFSRAWAAQKFSREIADFVRYCFEKTWQVLVGPLLLLATVPLSLGLLAPAIRIRPSRPEENRIIFGLFTAGSAVVSIVFVIWGWEENNEWRYRYLAMATAFAAVFMAMLLARVWASPGRSGWLAAGLLAGLLAATFIPALGRETVARAERNRQFLGQVEGLKQWLAAHTSARPMQGFGEYWAAMDITARTDLRIDLVNTQARAQFYNNNAGGLCQGGHAFVLRKMRPDAPKRAEIIGLLGEPRAMREMNLEGHQEVEILVFDAAVIQARIVEEGKRDAARLFPTFRCPG